VVTPAEQHGQAGADDRPEQAPKAVAEPAKSAIPEPVPIPTGFPELVSPEPEREPSPDGMVRLAPAGFGSLTVPPLEEGGKTVVITAEGTDVDEETAERAHEAARLAGFSLREV